MDQTASELLSDWVDRYGDYLFRYAVSRLRDRDRAEEVVQQAFVAAFEHFDQYAGTASPRSWLMGILKNKIVDTVRQYNREQPLPDDSDVDQLFDAAGNWRAAGRNSWKTSMDSMERDEFWRAFQHCLNRLPPRQADLFVLRELENQSTEVLCKDMGITPSNLWVRLHRARMRLLHCMKRRWIR